MTEQNSTNTPHFDDDLPSQNDRTCLINSRNVNTNPGELEGDNYNNSLYGTNSTLEDSMSSQRSNRSQHYNDELRLLQAQVFIEDATEYRSINHKVEYQPLKLYQLYHSEPFIFMRYIFIFVLHILAFFEKPSSLSWTSDIRERGDRIELPCGVTEGIELLCLVFLLGDIVIKSHVYGYRFILTNRWLTVEALFLVASMIDWSVSVAIGCTEVVRFRRMLRPVFIIQNSSLMKKILNSLRKTMSQILGVLLLMALHVFIFTLFAMLLFPKPTDTSVTGNTIPTVAPSNVTNGTTQPNESEYFKTLTDSFMSLLVLLTTANNPDITLPAYRQNRLYAGFFIVFLFIGLFCFMNMLTAIIFTQFRGYFLSSMRSSRLRRRLGQRAAFETLKKKTVQMGLPASIADPDGEDGDIRERDRVSVRDVKLVISKSMIGKQFKIRLIHTVAEKFSQEQMLTFKQFQEIFTSVEHDRYQKQKPSIRWFRNHPCLVSFQKVICSRYFSFFGNFMALVNVVLVSFELATKYDKSLSSSKSALRIINFLFILYYMTEQSLIFICMGWRRYAYSTANLFDGVIVAVLMVSEIVTVALYGFPFFSNGEVHGDFTLWNIVRVINILIMVRLLRIIGHIKAMSIVAHTLVDLVKNLQSFGGILIVIYYFFAILGMELFKDKIVINSETANKTLQCGTYEQLGYWANNFDDFAASIVVLWDVMVVNNWMVFLYAYRDYTTKWSYLYFIAWWLISVVLALSLFTALIIENFTMKWDRYHTADNEQRERVDSMSRSFNMNTLTIHEIFSPTEDEPSEEEVESHLNNLTYFRV